ncbi:MAG: CHAT domain-containing protein [Bdellovibrio bacteriovorus]
MGGDDLARRVADLRDPPRLMVLASCESAGTGEVQGADEATAAGAQTSPQAALAPLLAAAGVPAVLAMQGQISMETTASAMPCFFSELVKDGQLDRALAVARGRVRDRPDAWVPALFLRLRGGRLWYQPGFGGNGQGGTGDERSAAVKWAALVNDIQQKRFTPIIGWGLAEGIFGSTQDLAERLAAANRFPLAPYQRTDLPQVSEYLLVSQQSSDFPLDAVKTQVRQEILARHRDVLAPEDQGASLSALVKKVGARLRQDAQDPYRLVAALPARSSSTPPPTGC